MSSEERGSEVISIRLHPSDQYEKSALKIIHDLEGQGFSKRQIITDAINRAGGRRPEMFKQDGSALTVGALQNILADFAKELLSQLAAGGTQTRQTEPEQRHTEDGSEYERNLAASFLARRNKR